MWSSLLLAPVLLLANWGGVSSTASSLPETLALDEAVVGLEQLSAFVVKQDVKLGYDRFSNQVFLDLSTVPKPERHALVEQALKSPHVAHVGYDPGGEVVMWLTSTQHEVYFAKSKARGVKGLRVLVGKSRRQRVGRRHWFGSTKACLASMPEGTHKEYVSRATMWCEGKLGDRLSTKGVDPRLMGQTSSRALEVLKFEVGMPDAHKAATLLDRYKDSPKLRGQVYLIQAMAKLRKQSLAEGLELLTMAKAQVRFGEEEETKQLEGVLQSLGQGVLERMLMAKVDEGEHGEVVKLTKQHRRWLGQVKPGLWRLIALSYRKDGKPREGAKWYEQMLDHVDGVARRAVYGELVTTYLEAGRGRRGKMMLDWLREGGKVKIKSEAMWLVEWAHLGKCDMKESWGAACAVMAKPQKAMVLDMVLEWEAGAHWPVEMVSKQKILWSD